MMKHTEELWVDGIADLIPSSTENEKALTVLEAAEQLRVKSRTVAMWLRQGRLPGFQAGREWRVAQSTVNRLLRGELKLGTSGSKIS